LRSEGRSAVREQNTERQHRGGAKNGQSANASKANREAENDGGDNQQQDDRHENLDVRGFGIVGGMGVAAHGEILGLWRPGPELSNVEMPPNQGAAI
jgi:hypothetical protein